MVIDPEKGETDDDHHEEDRTDERQGQQDHPGCELGLELIKMASVASDPGSARGSKRTDHEDVSSRSGSKPIGYGSKASLKTAGGDEDLR